MDATPTWILVTAAIGFVGVLFLLKKLLATPKRTGSLAQVPKPVFLDGTRKSIPLIKKIELSHDTRLFRFGLSTSTTILGLPVGKHFRIFCPNTVGSTPGKWNGIEDKEYGKNEIQRSYTPTSSNDDLGYLDLVIKVYRGGVIDRFPDGGKVSQYLESLKIGDKIEVQGPFGLVEYVGNGTFNIKRKPKTVKRVGMIAGGTGITPMLQIIAAVLKNPQDKTHLSLLFANQTEADILVRDKLEKYQKQYPERFSLWYTLDRPDSDWKYSVGFISDQMIKEHLPAPSSDTLILMCGPPVMIERACIPNLEKLGFTKEDYCAF